MGNFPFISIILPVRNVARNIKKNLASIFAQDYPNELIEIFVVDGMSVDGTREIITGEIGKHPNMRMVDNPDQIVPIGMNLAIRLAKGEIIVRIDGNTQIEPDYVRQCIRALELTGADNVGGRMRAIGDTFFGQTASVATSIPFGVGNARFHYLEKEAWVDTVYMGAWPREVFDKIGLFDEELVRDQDDEFNYRLRERGGKIFLSPKIKSLYTMRSSPGELWKQYYQYGVWKVRVLQKHPRQMGMRQFIPPLLVAALVVSLILSLAFYWGWFFLAVSGGSYLLVNLAVSIYTAIKKGYQHLCLLPVAFAILHLAYGAGFLAGLIIFWRRWGDKVGRVPKA